jgi:hypothetical protein
MLLERGLLRHRFLRRLAAPAIADAFGVGIKRFLTRFILHSQNWRSETGRTRRE